MADRDRRHKQNESLEFSFPIEATGFSDVNLDISLRFDLDSKSFPQTFNRVSVEFDDRQTNMNRVKQVSADKSE